MRPDDFFSAVERRQVQGSPFLVSHVAANVTPLELAEAQDIVRRTNTRIVVAEAGIGICRVCGEERYLSRGHSTCGSCRSIPYAQRPYAQRKKARGGCEQPAADQPGDVKASPGGRGSV